jgi:hypothetical protein
LVCEPNGVAVFDALHSCPVPAQWPAGHTQPKKAGASWRSLFSRGTTLNDSKRAAPMIDPLSRAGRELKAAEEFFELAKNASSPFMQAYYRRVAERFLSSQGELKSVKRRGDGTEATVLKFAPSPAL